MNNSILGLMIESRKLGLTEEYSKLKEKLFSGGNMKYSNNDYFEIYENPTENEMKNDIMEDSRGYIDKEGNLYVCQNYSAIHIDLLRSLEKELLTELKDYDIYSGLCVQRYENTNIFVLGESYRFYVQDKRYTRKDLIMQSTKYMKKCKILNPHLEFIPLFDSNALYSVIKKSSDNLYTYFVEELTPSEKILSIFLNENKDDGQIVVDGDTAFSDEELLKAVEKIKEDVKIDRSYDIPYIAGYSTDGKTIYIDKDLPEQLEIEDKKYNVDPFLILHESVEKSLLKELDLDYQLAHQIALRAEIAAVKAAGIDIDIYNEFMKKYVKIAGDKSLDNVPKDLDKTPYIQENDIYELEKMKNAK